MKNLSPSRNSSSWLSGITCLLPFLGRPLSILLLLTHRPDIFNLLVKYTSSRLEQFKTKSGQCLSCNSVKQHKRKHSSWVWLRDSSTALPSQKEFQKTDLHPFTPSLTKIIKADWDEKVRPVFQPAGLPVTQLSQLA